jgi:hypothetical protein
MAYSLDEQLFDPGGFLPGYTAPTTNYSSTGSFNGPEAGGTDWGGFFTSTLKLLPSIISATQGHPYGSTPYGQQSAPYAGGAPGGQGVYAGGSFLGASGFGNISGTTLILLGVVAFMLLKRK